MEISTQKHKNMHVSMYFLHLVLTFSTQNDVMIKLWSILVCDSRGLRPIMDSEIGYALLHISVDRFCNPRSPTGTTHPCVLSRLGAHLCVSALRPPPHFFIALISAVWYKGLLGDLMV